MVDSEATVKRFNKKHDNIRLHLENPNMTSILIHRRLPLKLLPIQTAYLTGKAAYLPPQTADKVLAYSTR